MPLAATAASPCAPAPKADRSSPNSRTTARAFRRTCCPRSSTRSSPPRGRRAGPASAWRSATASSPTIRGNWMFAASRALPTTFRMTLPIARRGGRVKLLVVEDDKTVGQYVKRGLEEQQYIADWVTDGDEALRLVSTVPYDLLILDLRLPGMTGLEVLRNLRDRGLTAAGPGAHGAGQRGVQGRRAACRRRRLRHQAVFVRGTAGARRGAVAPAQAALGARVASGRPGARSRVARGAARRHRRSS